MSREAPTTGPFQQLVGYRAFVEPDESVRLALDLDARHTSQYGIAHGGVTLTLLDAAGGLAVLVAAGDLARVATISLAANFVRGVRPGRVEAFGRVDHLGSTIAHARMHLVDAEGTLLAEAQGAYRLFRDHRPHNSMPSAP